MSKPLSRYRTTVAVDGRAVRVTYADTLIVDANATAITLNSGGWRTRTTKEKMTAAAAEFGLGFTVFQKRGEWYVCRLGRAPCGNLSAAPEHGAIVMPYHDGMVIGRTTLTLPRDFAPRAIAA